MVGDVYKLQIACLGNSIGTIGVCFNEYQDFENPSQIGCQIIFESGHYDGFSYSERNEYQIVKKIGCVPNLQDYNFVNVMKLSEDFSNGVFNQAFMSENY